MGAVSFAKCFINEWNLSRNILKNKFHIKFFQLTLTVKTTKVATRKVMPNVIIIDTNTPLNLATTSSVSALTLAGIGTGWLITSISQSSHPANCVKDCHNEYKELKLSFLSEPPILLGMDHRHGMSTNNWS